MMVDNCDCNWLIHHSSGRNLQRYTMQWNEEDRRYSSIAHSSQSMFCLSAWLHLIRTCLPYHVIHLIWLVSCFPLCQSLFYSVLKHFLHSVLALLFLANPTCLHLSQSTLVSSAQQQDSNKVAPSSELQVPAGQRLQEPMSPKPVALLQVPNGQSMHAFNAQKQMKKWNRLPDYHVIFDCFHFINAFARLVCLDQIGPRSWKLP